MAGVSFRPQISSGTSRRGRRSPEARQEYHLRYREMEKEDRMERLKAEQEFKILEECNNFRPKINPRSL